MTTPDFAALLALALQQSSRAIVMLWLCISLGGCFYTAQLWCRARRDVRWHKVTGTNGLFREVAIGNLRRVQVRLLMFAGFVGIGLIAFGLAAFPPGLWREAARLAYVALFLAINFLLLFNAWADERHDRLLRRLIHQAQESEQMRMLSTRGGD